MLRHLLLILMVTKDHNEPVPSIFAESIRSLEALKALVHSVIHFQLHSCCSSEFRGCSSEFRGCSRDAKLGKNFQ